MSRILRADGEQVVIIVNGVLRRFVPFRMRGYRDVDHIMQHFNIDFGAAISRSEAKALKKTLKYGPGLHSRWGMFQIIDGRLERFVFSPTYFVRGGINNDNQVLLAKQFIEFLSDQPLIKVEINERAGTRLRQDGYLVKPLISYKRNKIPRQVQLHNTIRSLNDMAYRLGGAGLGSAPDIVRIHSRRLP